MIWTQAAASDDTVDVRMVGESLPPCMKNGEKPDFGAEVFRVSGYGLMRFQLLRQESCRSGVEQQFVEHGLILQRQRIELFGNGEDDVINALSTLAPVVDGQQISLALFDPLAQEL